MMGSRCRGVTALYGAVVLVAVAIGPSAALAEELAPPPTVPPGMTLVEVVRELRSSSAQVLWNRIGDAEGRTLLVSDGDQPGVANCVGECAKQFPPLLAAPGAKAFGDWSLVSRPSGQMQWAYQSRPLYTWSQEEEPGEVATNVGLTETANLKLAEDATMAGELLPLEGWQVARFDPGASMAVPDGIDVQLVSSAQGVVLTDFAGYTLYAFDGDAADDGQTCSDQGCEIEWLPVVAPTLALDVGDFSVVIRADGSRQWAHLGQPLYRYSGDLLPGDVHGRAVNDRWRVALLTQNFRPPEVAVNTLEGYGDAMSVRGLTLYTGSAFQKYWGGRNLRDSFKISYHRGKRLGGDACAEAACLKVWRPFEAAADAVSHGFWEVFTRSDGTGQWAYKGYAVYTHADDTAPGHNRGQATYAFASLEGNPEELSRAARLANLGSASGGAGVYWNVAKP